MHMFIKAKESTEVATQRKCFQMKPLVCMTFVSINNADKNKSTLIILSANNCEIANKSN